jgi:hypothetical protein
MAASCRDDGAGHDEDQDEQRHGEAGVVHAMTIPDQDRARSN